MLQESTLLQRTFSNYVKCRSWKVAKEQLNDFSHPCNRGTSHSIHMPHQHNLLRRIVSSSGNKSFSNFRFHSSIIFSRISAKKNELKPRSVRWKKNHLHSLKLRFSPWKLMFGRRSFPFGIRPWNPFSGANTLLVLGRGYFNRAYVSP